MRTCTVWDAVALVERSWLWMAFVTTPATTLLGAAWLAAASGPPDVGAAAVTVLLVSVPTGVGSLGGAVLAVPFTFVLGRVLVRCRAHRQTAVVAHALLAGALAAGCIALLIVSWHLLWAPLPTLSVSIGVAAGTAAGIATWRATRPSRPRRADRDGPTGTGRGRDGAATGRPIRTTPE